MKFLASSQENNSLEICQILIHPPKCHKTIIFSKINPLHKIKKNILEINGSRYSKMDRIKSCGRQPFKNLK